MKTVWMIAFGIVIATVAALLVLRTEDTDLALMQEKYGGTNSLYVETSDGLSVRYRDQGCQTCPAIILIHGSNSSLHTFEPLVERLADRYRLISYDQPGHGLTGAHPDDDYSATSMFKAVDALVGATGVNEFAIAGSSMGGWVAWRYALENPERVAALILIGASGAPHRPTSVEARLHLGARIMKSSVGRRLAERIAPRFLVEQSLLDSVSDPNLVTDEMVDRYWELLRLPGNRRAAGQLAVTDREPEFGERLGELRPRTLILWGEEDQVVPVSNAATFREEIPNAVLQVFERVGHLPAEEVPEKSALAIDRFLRL